MRSLCPAGGWLGVLALGSFVGAMGCVGPTTPLGAIDSLVPAAPAVASPELAVGETRVSQPQADLPTEPGEFDPGRPAPLPAAPQPPPQPPPPKKGIFFVPAFQQAHGPYAWRVVVLDPEAPKGPDPQRVRITYNDQDVTRAAKTRLKLETRLEPRAGETALVATMPRLRLDPMEDHRIQVSYLAPGGQRWEADYTFPRVEDFEAQEPIVSTAPFEVAPRVLAAIEEASRAYRINPSLLAALIAQESGFDPLALSRVGALGLTQVTHLTEPDIARAFPEWPRYPGIQRLSRRRLHKLVPATINGDNEWRLDPVKSVWGGAYYLSHLRDRVENPVNARFVGRAGPATDEVYTALVLAAYNSGLNRILYYAKRFGPRWLNQRRAREAKRYVRKILSYYGAFRSPADGGLSLRGEKT